MTMPVNPGYPTANGGFPPAPPGYPGAPPPAGYGAPPPGAQPQAPPGYPPQTPAGYPGAPPPVTYGAPQPAAPPPGYGGAPPAQPPGYGYPGQLAPAAAPGGFPAGPASVGGFGPGAFSGATVVDGQDPSPGPGDYVFKVISTQLKTERSRTFIGRLEIVNSSNPAFPPGVICGFVQSLDGADSFKFGMSAILCMVLTAHGYQVAHEAHFKSACPTWAQLLDAMCDSKQQLPNNPWPANPLAGKFVRANVTDSGAVTKAKGKNPGGKPIMRFAFSPAT